MSSEQEVRTHSRRSALAFLLGAGASAATLRWISQQPQEQGLPAPLRRTLQVNEKVARGLLAPNGYAETYPPSQAVQLRVNGSEGLQAPPPSPFHLTLKDGGKAVQVTPDELRRLPATQLTLQLRCVEGWSQITSWTGVPLAAVAAHYGLDTSAEFAGLRTPDGGYYVGLDRTSALHPQTLLAYDLLGQPLSQEHGAPLRLVVPSKYGVKWLKSVGEVAFTSHRPPDYWYEQGYDYHLGL